METYTTNLQTITQIIKDTYEYIFGKVYNWVDFELKMNERNSKFIENFIHLLNKEIGLDSVGRDYVFNYTIYQFKYYEEKRTSRDIQLNWVYGKKAYKRWKEKRENWSYFNSLYCKKYDLELEHFNSYLDKEKYKDRERQRFYNTEAGLYYCILMQLNTNRKSKLCRFCKFKEECYEP